MRDVFNEFSNIKKTKSFYIVKNISILSSHNIVTTLIMSMFRHFVVAL